MSANRLLRPFAPLGEGETYRALLFFLTALPLGVLGAALLLAGWMLALLLAITPLVVPVLIGLRAVVGTLAGAESGLARELLGATARPRTRSPRGGFWRSGLNVLTDSEFWKQQSYLMLRFAVGGALAIALFSVVATAFGAIALPIYYRWSDGPEFGGGWRVDTLPEALLFVPAGLVVLVLALRLVRPLATVWRRLALSLLDSDAREQAPAEVRASRRRALTAQAVAYATVNLFLILIWALTSRGYFWPVWTLLQLGLPLAVSAWVVAVDEWPGLARRQRLTRGLAIHEGVAASVFLFLVIIWALTSRGYFWPVWPGLALAIVFAIHVAVVFSRGRRRRELAERIAVLETTRAGAVDVQETELRRIERDLHDGAQARLVALGMSIGMAEQKLQTDPEGAQELLADARRGAREALEELRDLARGIHPPVLTDRGLEAALVTLADRSPLPVELAVDVGERPGPAIESAAYFVVAEALANASKHAGATRVEIRVDSGRGLLLVEVTDDGRGGADPSGHGLIGLARRVQALDGTLTVASPQGGPTTVRAELPCAS